MENDHSSDYIFKAYVVNTAAYDAGDREASGAWLYFPTYGEAINEVMEQIGLPAGAPPGKYFIDDYVCRIDGMKPVLPMYCDFGELAMLAQGLSDLSLEDRDLLAAVQESPYRLTTLEQFREFPHNTEFFTLEPSIKRLDDLGWSYVAQHMDILLTPPLLDAIDPVPFGKHAMEEDKGCLTNYGYLAPPGDEWQHEQDARPAKKQAEKKPSIMERLEQSKKECAGQNKAQPHRGKSAPEL
ncbi:antirestriction protein ArdA [Agathobaculum sp.]|uniref:antirestriction protein ArdA n=1 Tax=Agathobaculum sp. TaxID=2048138 RepID=UPI002A822F71|nr:antirestriction protein ArdA [Agathobaculum sp.]MDY3617993.1 hypothetical protein [Agathobaculum sp.]